jgi:hypothetical protein
MSQVRHAGYGFSPNIYAISAAGVSIPWDVEHSQDDDTFSQSGAYITLKKLGKYLVWWWCRAEHGAGATNGRREVRGTLYKNGTLLYEGRGSGYIRGTAGADHTAFGGFSMLDNTDTSHTLYLNLQKTGGTTASDPYPYIEGVAPNVKEFLGISLLKLRDDWDYCRCTTSSNSGNLSSAAWISLYWGAIQEEDADTFDIDPTGSDAREIKLKQPGRYLITGTIHAYTGSTTVRHNPRIKASYNGVKLFEVADTLRSSDGCNDTILSFIQEFDITTANQILEIECLEGASNNPSSEYVVAGSNIQIVKLPDTAHRLAIHDDSGTQRADLDDTDLDFSDTDREDASFSHTPGSNVTELNKNGHYLYLAQFDSARAGTASGNRIEQRGAWYKVNTSTELKRGQKGSYNRGKQVYNYDYSGWCMALLAVEGEDGEQVGVRLYEDSSLTDANLLFSSTGMQMQVINLDHLFPDPPMFQNF